jgi:hypothetical protein
VPLLTPDSRPCVAGRSDSAGMPPAAGSGRLVEFAADPLDISLIAHSSPLS